MAVGSLLLLMNTSDREILSRAGALLLQQWRRLRFRTDVDAKETHYYSTSSGRRGRRRLLRLDRQREREARWRWRRRNCNVLHGQ